MGFSAHLLVFRESAHPAEVVQILWRAFALISISLTAKVEVVCVSVWQVLHFEAVCDSFSSLVRGFIFNDVQVLVFNVAEEVLAQIQQMPNTGFAQPRAREECVVFNCDWLYSLSYLERTWP